MNALEKTDTPGLYRRGTTWVAVASYRERGQIRKKWITAATKRQALADKAAFLADVKRGHRPSRSRQSTGEYLESWITERAVAGRTANTIKSYRRTKAAHLGPIEHVPLADLADDHVIDLLAGIESMTTAAYVFTVLNAALNRAVKRGFIPANPCVTVDAPKAQREEAAYLDPSETPRMFGDAEGSPIEAGILLGLGGGLRVGEAAAIRWSDIDFASGRITVARSWWGRTKSGKARTFVLPAGILAALRRVRMRQAEQLLAIGVRATADTHAVATPFGEPMSPDALGHRFSRFCRDHGYAITFHGLRHSNAVALLTSGVDVKTAAARLGHDPVVLLRTYSRHIPSADRAAAERLNVAFGGEPG